MKPFTFFTALLLLANLSSLHAQTTNVWKGGFPGHETDWNHHRNWSLGKTPDGFDRVIIQDVSTSTLKYPVVKDGEIEVLSLEVRTGASLTLLPSAHILTDKFVCQGTCNGCQNRILVKSTEATTTALRQ